MSKGTSRDVPLDTNYIKSVSKRLLAFDFLVVLRFLAGHIINLKLFTNSLSFLNEYYLVIDFDIICLTDVFDFNIEFIDKFPSTMCQTLKT